MPTYRSTPKVIKPELINVGDLIEVTLPEVRGLTTKLRGRVAKIQAHAGMRHFLTDDGSVIARYTPGQNPNTKFVLIERQPLEQATLDLFDMVV